MIKQSVMMFFILLSLFFLFGTANRANAVNVIGYEISQTELQKLPEYLQIRLIYHFDSKHPEYTKWSKIMGASYSALHHYAIGLVCIERSKLNKNRKNFYLTDAKDQFGYVINHSENLPILHEVYAKRGDVNFYLSDIRAAVLDYTMAMKIRKDYLYAYLRLSECYSSLGMKKEAKEIVKMMENIIGTEKSSD